MDALRKNFNIPNTVTAIRALGLPFALSAFMGGKYRQALILFVLLALSDTIDGYLARRLKQVTAFGKVFDSVMDKALTISFLFVLLIIPGPIGSGWEPALEVAFGFYFLAEIGLAGSRIERLKQVFGFVAEDGATKVSKVKMWALCTAVSAMLLGLAASSAWLVTAGRVVFLFAALVAVLSFAARFEIVSMRLRSYRRIIGNRWVGYCWRWLFC